MGIIDGFGTEVVPVLWAYDVSLNSAKDEFVGDVELFVELGFKLSLNTDGGDRLSNGSLNVYCSVNRKYMI